MKKLEAIIRKSKFKKVKKALIDGGFNSFNYRLTRCISEKSETRFYRGVEFESKATERVLLSIYVRDKNADSVIDILITGNEFAIFIENKMSGGSETVNKNGEKQPDREYRDSKDLAPNIDEEKKLFIFINPTGKSASCNEFITIDRYDMENIFLRIASGVNCVGIGDSNDTYIKMFLKFYADFYFRCI